MTRRGFRRDVVWTCILASTIVAASCGSDSPELRVAEIDDAVAAVVAATGGEPNFFEINATPDLVNLFLDDGRGSAINFVWEDGGLREETEAASADGRSFDASSMTFTPDVYEQVTKELPDSLLRALTITADGPNGEVLHRVVIQSERGGQFAVLVDPTGKILGSDPLTGP
ncbi:MAG: hypothetical protein RL743_1178 [Actinomycetota bacterium]|jgi:hypothetical protein